MNATTTKQATPTGPLARLYLRASTDEQDATRAAGELDQFAAEHGLRVVARYVENASGAKLDRPELRRMLNDAGKGDLIVVEQVDRLTRLTGDDWSTLRGEIDAKGLKIVALDVPTSWALLNGQSDDPVTRAVLEAVNRMMVELLAATARKDYEDRRRRQAQGIAKAKAAGLYKGRPINAELHENIRTLKEAGKSWSAIERMTGAARTTIARALRG